MTADGVSKPEDMCVLVPAGCREFRCCQEGDQAHGGDVRGDVVFTVDAIMPDDEYRIHPTRHVLQRLVWLSPEEVCYGISTSAERVVDVCGEQVGISLPAKVYETWNADRLHTPKEASPANEMEMRFDSGHVIVVPRTGLITTGADVCMTDGNNNTPDSHSPDDSTSEPFGTTETLLHSESSDEEDSTTTLVRDVLELVCVVRDQEKDDTAHSSHCS